MLKVFLVDNTTRLILCDSAWSRQAVRTLVERGHTVVEVFDDSPFVVEAGRSDAEAERAMALLDKIPM
jgi:ferric-dicitrate binding protein FerR (iron transport regulator)